MPPRGNPQRDTSGRHGIAYALVLALLLAVPLWVVVGLVLIWAFQATPITQTQSVVMFAALACELILLRYVLRTSGALVNLRQGFERHTAVLALKTPWNPLVKQSLTLLALVGAYMQYYMWEVLVQIESLNSVTVFVPVAAIH